jgi:hypothetical protein
MRDIGGHIHFSATDLMRFLGCAHAPTLEPALKTKRRGALVLLVQKGCVVWRRGRSFRKWWSSFCRVLLVEWQASAGIKHKSLVEQANSAD